jgi:hypothetical protein
MDTELILAIVGVVFAVVALGVLSVFQQARLKREKRQKREKAETAAHSTGVPLKPFFVACYRGSKGRFFRVYPDEDAFLFVHAGPYMVLLDAETPRGEDRRHWLVQAAKFLAAGLLIGAAVAGVIVFTVGRTLVGNNNPETDPVMYGLIGLAALLVVGFAVALPAVVWRVARRADELDALSPDALRAEAETELSFRADHSNFFDIKFSLLEQRGSEVCATLTFRHKPTGNWQIELTTTRDTRAAIAEFLDALGEDIVIIEESLQERLDAQEERER